jgi:hypothetical protein
MKTKSTRIAVLIVTAGIGSAIAGTGAPTTFAAPGSCAPGYICVYDGANYGPPQYSVTTAAYSLGSMNDKASSLGNSRSVNRARYYQDANYGGWDVCVSATDAMPTLAADRNDRISSMAIEVARYC